MSDVIIGIDLGTTNSLVAVCENGIPRILADETGEVLVPSVVQWSEKTKSIVVGQVAKSQRLSASNHTASSIKRFMGQGKKDLDPKILDHIDTTASTEENILIRLGPKSFTAIQLSAEILKQLKKMAEKSLGHTVTKAVVTVPAYFNDGQRTATKMAGTLAGLDVVRIVNEPTAASLAYGLDKKKQGLIAVYDLGGGTFDLSILKLQSGIFEVVATSGDTALGGDDFDNAVASIVKEQIIRAGGAPDLLDDIKNRASIIEIAEEIKKELSAQEFVEKTLTLHGEKFLIKMTKDTFEKSIQSLIKKTLDLTSHALSDASLDKSQIDDIVMVGGSTRVPLVRKAVKEFFGKEINTSVNPDQVVAMGAAIQADILAGKNTEMVLLDVVPLSLGIETYGGTIGKLIHRNTKIPSMAQETFTTHVEGQRNVLIHVLQGERELAGDCRSLARFNLKDLPPMPAGLPKIQVTFLIDSNGILTVKAVELATQVASQIEVKPSYGMTDEQVEKMLEQSFEFAESDLKTRQLIDTRVEAEGVLNATERILKAAGETLDSEILAIIKTEAATVRILMAGNDYLAIRNALEKLETVAKPLAENVMNQALQGSLKKKHVDEVLKK